MLVDVDKFWFWSFREEVGDICNFYVVRLLFCGLVKEVDNDDKISR